MKYTMRWGSHIPVLVKLLSITKGDVLELGMGIYSTPLLFWECISKERKLVSYDNNEKYFNMVGNNNNRFHESHLISDWNNLDIEKPWDVVFIDTNPMEVRKELARKVSNHSKFVVLHDTQSRDEIYYHYEEIYPLFKYRFDYTKFIPNTSVLSNFESLEFMNEV
jgi:hypothetical protein